MFAELSGLCSPSPPRSFLPLSFFGKLLRFRFFFQPARLLSSKGSLSPPRLTYAQPLDAASEKVSKAGAPGAAKTSNATAGALQSQLLPFGHAWILPGFRGSIRDGPPAEGSVLHVQILASPEQRGGGTFKDLSCPLMNSFSQV